MKSISEEIAENTARFEDPKYNHRVFESYESLCVSFSDTFNYLSGLPRQEFFDSVDAIRDKTLIDFQDPEGAAIISILKNRLEDHIDDRARFLDMKGRPVNGYQPGRHC